MMKKFIPALLFLLPLTVQAENLDLKYEASWSGIKAGTAEVIINETDNRYNDRVRADAVGMVKSLTNYWTTATAEGVIANGIYQPGVYDVIWQPKKAPQQEMILNYPNGRIAVTANPPEIRKKHPDVSDNDKRGLPDPISAAMMARQRIKQIVQSGQALPQSFTIRIFDSHRITDLNLTVSGYEDIKIDGKPQKLLKILYKRQPVAGYSDKELKTLKSMDLTVSIYTDNDFIPVYATGQAVIGEVSIKLVSK